MADATQHQFSDPTPASATDHDYVGVNVVTDLCDDRSRSAILHDRPVSDARGSQPLAPFIFEVLLHIGSPFWVELQRWNRGHVPGVKVDRRGDRKYRDHLGAHPFRHSHGPVEGGLRVLRAVHTDDDPPDARALCRHLYLVANRLIRCNEHPRCWSRPTGLLVPLYKGPSTLSTERVVRKPSFVLKALDTVKSMLFRGAEPRPDLGSQLEELLPEVWRQEAFEPKHPFTCAVIRQASVPLQSSRLQRVS